MFLCLRPEESGGFVCQQTFDYVSGYIYKEFWLARIRLGALTKYRSHLKQRGLVRVEVQVSAADADLIRRTARSLRDETQGATRPLL